MKLRLLIIGSILALSLSACISLAEDITPPPESPAPSPAETVPPPSREESIEGKELFAANCARCHAADGTGKNNAADLTNGERMGRFPDAMLSALIAQGKGSQMPAFEQTLNSTEIASLVSYLRQIEKTTPLVESAEQEAEQAQTTVKTEEAEGGTVRGQIINGSQSGNPPEGLIVRLEIYEHDLNSGNFNRLQTLETEADAAGNYRFDNLDMRAGRVFLAFIEKDGVKYTSQANYGTDTKTVLELPITYYETSTDTAHINIDRLHIFFEPPDTENNTIRAVEVFVISNPTLYAITAAEEGKAVLEFDLPEGASKIQFEDGFFGERYTRTETGFGDTKAVLPGVGSQEIVVFFELPFKRNLDFSQKISLPVDSVIVMTPQGLKIKSDYLQKSGEREAQGILYNTYASQAMPIGATFKMKIYGKVSLGNAALDPNAQQNLLYGLLSFGIVLIIVGTWFYLREKEKENTKEDTAQKYEDTETLLDAIIALDDAYRNGQIHKAAYQKRRNTLKKRLKDLVKS